MPLATDAKRIRKKLIESNDADLIIVWLLIAVTVALFVAPYLKDSVVRSIFGLVFALLVPGYVLVAALFPGKSDLGNAERAALSLGIGIAITALVGLTLNGTSWGVRLQPMVALLVLFGVVCSLVTLSRRNAVPPDERYGFSLAALTRKWTSALSKPAGFDRRLNVLLALSIIAAVSVTTYSVLAPRPGASYTEFYIVGPSGQAQDYPVQFALGEQKPVVVGIVNHENRDQTYTLVVGLNETTRVQHIYSEDMTVAQNQRWEKTIFLKPDAAGTNMKMQFLLYIGTERASPYRDAYFWVNVTQP